MAANPYTPGAGLYPPHLAGREHALRALGRAQEAVEAGRGTSPLVVTGLRGMGKTSLLLRFRDQLGASGWLVPGLQEFDSRRSLTDMWRGLRSDVEALSPRALRRRRRRLELDTVQLQAAGELGLTGPRVRAEASGTLRRTPDSAVEEQVRSDALELLRAVFDRGLSLALLFDEAQDAAIDDLGLLAEMGHRAGQERWPLLIVFAGLNPLHDKLVRARSYASRFPPVPVGPLADGAAEEALLVPARERAVQFEPDALSLAASFAGGVPFHLQMVGLHVWELKRGDRITRGVVSKAGPVALDEIAQAMYRPLWNRASEMEQEYLIAMATVQRTHHGIPVAEVLHQLERDHRSGAKIRSRLVDKGLIHPLRYGHLEFSYPGFQEFIQRELEARTGGARGDR